MADENIKQVIQDAILDADSLERFINGSDSETVLTRLSAEYPTLQKAIKTMFENGGLPATPFKTKALMTASSLANDSYALVTDDSVAANIGLYVKTAGAWVKSSYDLTLKADRNKTVLFKDFEQGWVVNSGNEIPSDNVLRSPVYKLKAGTVIKASRSGNYYFAIQTSASEKVGHNLNLWKAESNYEITVTSDKPYVRLFILHRDTQTELDIDDALRNVKISQEFGVVYEDGVNEKLKSISDVKADKLGRHFFTDFEQGWVDRNGDEIPSDTVLRSPVYKLKAGTEIHLNRLSNPSLYVGVGVSRNEKVSHDSNRWIGSMEHSVVVSEDQPFVRFFIIDRQGALPDVQELIGLADIYTESEVAYKDFVDLSIGELKEDLGRVTDIDFNSMYRTPSRAEGGVISFIDDDGRDAVYSILYPLFKSKGLPFASAIIPDRIGRTIGELTYLTLEELHELAEDVDTFEIMSHGFSHTHLSSTSNSEAVIERDIYKAKKWFKANGFIARGLVYPYGADDAVGHSIAQKYYSACYDYDSVNYNTMEAINNNNIGRFIFWDAPDNLDKLKSAVDGAIANNAWMVVCLHVDAATYWGENSEAELSEFLDYIKTTGISVLKPSEGFQTFGNILQNDSGFKIQADGKIVGAS